MPAAAAAGDSHPIPTLTTRDRKGASRTSLQAVRARFARDEGLPFAEALTEARSRDVVQGQGARYRDRLFDPVTTLGGFRSQVRSEGHSGREAVARLLAHRAANGAAVGAPPPASYGNARGRLLPGVLRTRAQRTAQPLPASAAPEGKWNGRGVFGADGSTASMPDTPDTCTR